MPRKKMVFMVTRGEYSDYRVIGIFSTKEGAERAARFHLGDIDERVIDSEEIPDGLFVWAVRMDRAGNSNYAHQDEPHGLETKWHLTRNLTTNELGLRVTCLAKSKRHAIKITNEIRTRLLALNLWDRPQYGQYRDGEIRRTSGD